MFTQSRRIIKTGFVDMWRNPLTSLAAILIFIITLFIIGSLILSTVFLDSALEELKSKVDINVYLTADATEEEAISLLDKIVALPEVKSAKYLSPEEVLAQFEEDNEGDFTIRQSLDELGTNPLVGEIHILAQDPNQYESIANFLEGEQFLSTSGEQIISKVNFEEVRRVIERFSAFVSFIERFGLYTSILFVIIAVIVAFNTIKLVIFSSREEIGVKRLVGAENTYISGPYVVEGVIYGIIAAVVTLISFYPLTAWVANATERFFGGIDLFSFYIENFFLIAGVLFGSGILLGIISSALAVNKYLKK